MVCHVDVDVAAAAGLFRGPMAKTFTRCTALASRSRRGARSAAGYGRENWPPFPLVQSRASDQHSELYTSCAQLGGMMRTACVLGSRA